MNNKRAVVVARDIETTITFEDKYRFDVIIDVDLLPGNDFEINAKFQNLSITDQTVLNDLYKMPKALKVYSPYFEKEEFNFPNVVAKNIEMSSSGTASILFLSDYPFDLEIKK